MNCDEVRDSLEAYDAGELPQDEAERIADHLASCRGCEVECEGLRELAADLRHSRDSFRPLCPFEVPVVQPTSQPRRRKAWVAVGAVAALWMVLLTTAMLWPSLAARLTFFPVGRHLSSEILPSPSATRSGLPTSR